MTSVEGGLGLSETNAVFIVRSVGERTEQACIASLAAAGVPEHSVRVVNEAPFSQALVRSFELGVESGCKWTFCVDADMVFRGGAIATLLARAETLGNSDLGLNSLILDKFTISIRTAGVHLYRSEHLPRALELLRISSASIRPETALKQAMAREGHAWHLLPFVSGVHDFEQGFEDIFRKSYVHANKHLLHLPRLLPLWRELSVEDPDFRVAIEGAAFGIRERQSVTIDKRLKHVNEAWCSLGIAEKAPLQLKTLDPSAIDALLNGWALHNLEVHGVRASRDRIVRANLEDDPGAMLALWQDINALIDTRGTPGALAYAAGAVFKGIGNSLQRAKSPLRR
ncbi:hypothetical protein [Luteimonas sp. MC1828]|uniref:hypothetical protein n=1 Tax=Luteimonas sp. MC1828 TaxID=2799787 RepID=UPI0018F13513|nr:hypothetical protein [Luteimonas sp. MC1828]MBJ7574395.1 hypothetical protein [Luteimonas sp. MC1828]